ncbi:MAG: YkoF family thiamine/hydroxymethylpyrimidine-binding protein [Balneolaceae bacterium]
MTTIDNDAKKIAGCSFSVYPMADRFAPLILDALDKVNRSKVWMQTDSVSTIVRGRIPHIFDVTSAIFLDIASTGAHTVYSATFSIGCPGDTEGHAYMAEDEHVMNEAFAAERDQQVTAKFALYPMGGGNYMDTIYEQIEAMKTEGVEVELTHYETILRGKASDLFRGLQRVFAATDKAGSTHTVMTVTVSANSPSES